MPPAEGKVDEPLYTMTLDLSVLDHLGLNLYSNMPAVLSEAVANAWDADASQAPDRPGGRAARWLRIGS